MRALRGSVVLIDFWDYSCVNCIRTIPYVTEWYRRYRDKGLVVVGVHAPEFYFGSVTELVQIAIQDLGIEYPVLLDNDYQVWQAFANRYWPCKYLIDGEGYIRYLRPGEGHYLETEEAIQALLRELNPSALLPTIMKTIRAMDEAEVLQACERPTPELYLGTKRGPGKDTENVALRGSWELREECAEVAATTGGDPARLRLSYSAAEVNIVLAAGAACPIARLFISEYNAPLARDAWGADMQADPQGRTFVEVTRPRMYSLIRRDRFVSATAEFASDSTGLQLFAFTFISCVPRVEVHQ